VTGSYNGVPLAWNTANNGTTFSAVYTVAVGQSNTTYPLQISGVSIVDQYGNTIGPFSGSDIQKTVTATAVSGPITVYQSNPVPATGASQNPSYGFVSTEPGTIKYGGDCSSPTTSATAGLNTVVFNTLANGTHNDCTITVTDAAGSTSNQLVISPFTVGAMASIVTAPAPTTASSSIASEIQSLEGQLAQLQTQAAVGTSGSTTATPYDFTEFLSVGSQDAQVTALQNRLITDGFLSASATGYYGTLTETAVEKFQTAHGISPKGYVGPSTRAALNAGD
jgi:hypothetical protein